jgi:hypothetical protein
MAYQGIDQSESHLSKLLEIADMFSLTIEGAHRLFGYGFMIATANPIGASRMGALTLGPLHGCSPRRIQWSITTGEWKAKVSSVIFKPQLFCKRGFNE